MEQPKDHSLPDVIMFTTPWCGYCVRLKRQMSESGIGFREIDVDADHSHDEVIIEASGGYRTVPTLKIGSELLVNPTLAEVKAALGAGRG